MLVAGRIPFILNQATGQPKFGCGPHLACRPDFGHTWIRAIVWSILLISHFSLAYMADVQIREKKGKILHVQIGVSPEECIQLCTDNDECDYSNYRLSNKRCALHSYLKYAQSFDGAISAPNFCHPDSRETCKTLSMLFHSFVNFYQKFVIMTKFWKF